MIKKKKFFKRFLALFSVVLVLVSTLAFSAGAWSKTDIPFYNYFDVSKITPISATTSSVGITSVDPNTGNIRYKFYTNSNDTYQINYAILNLKLRDLCPDMVTGSTYVFSQYFASQNADVKPLDYLYLKPSPDTPAIKVTYGTPFVCTEELLNSYIILCAGNFPRGIGKPTSGSMVETMQRIWVNKGQAQRFEPYDLFKTIRDEAYASGVESGYTNGYDSGYLYGYDEGYNAGYSDGENYQIMDNLLVSYENVSMEALFYNANNGQYETKRYYNLPNYPFNGYSFNTKVLNPEYFTPPVFGSFLSRVQVTLIPKNFGEFYIVGQSALSFYSDGQSTLTLKALKPNDYTVYSKTYYLQEDTTIQIDFTELGLNVGDVISSLAFDVQKYAPTTYGVFPDFYFSFSNTSDNSYLVGVEDGKSLGYIDGYNDALEYAQSNIYSQGFMDGQLKGYDLGYVDGVEDGYYEGRTDESKENGFYKLIYSVVDAPISAFRSMFNFNLLGVDMAPFMMSLVTLAVFIVLLKKVFI